ncbi:hypothetical protein ACT453_26105 [Bacillus sp. D-CC]
MDDNSSDLKKYRHALSMDYLNLTCYCHSGITLSGQYAVKNVDTTFSGLESSGMTHMLSGRAMYDINERWDAGIHTGVLWSNMSSGRRVLVGGEVGYLLAANLWLSEFWLSVSAFDNDFTCSKLVVA